MDEAEWLTCACCGKGIRDNAAENVDFGKVPNFNDTGFGSCVECFGDKTLKGHDEPTIRKRLGWAGEVFYDSRIETLGKKLNPGNAAKFAEMPYAKKVVVIAGLVEKGAMI
jgi:hypothetical protein